MKALCFLPRNGLELIDLNEHVWLLMLVITHIRLIVL